MNGVSVSFLSKCYREKSSYVFYSKLTNLKPLKLLN